MSYNSRRMFGHRYCDLALRYFPTIPTRTPRCTGIASYAYHRSARRATRPVWATRSRISSTAETSAARACFAGVGKLIVTPPPLLPLCPRATMVPSDDRTTCSRRTLARRVAVWARPALVSRCMTPADESGGSPRPTSRPALRRDEWPQRQSGLSDHRRGAAAPGWPRG